MIWLIGREFNSVVENRGRCVRELAVAQIALL